MQIEHRFLILSCLAILLCNFPAAAFSSEEKIIAVTEVWPPFRIDTPDAEYGLTGIDVDLLKKLENEYGLEIEIQRHPFARCLQMIKTGEADVVTGIAHTEERAEYIHYVPTSYYSVGPVFYTQKGRGNLIKNYNDLYKFKVGYSLHSAYFEPFNSDTKIPKVGVSTEKQLVNMMVLGRLDTIIGTNPNLAYDIKKYGVSDKVEQTQYLPEQQTAIFFGLSRKKNNTKLFQQINNYLQKITETGEIQLIIEKYQ